ncbi:AEC family transporter, partial [Klebsiella pneumoniae]|nr:AEC family transporter [Klebsiella pneumoniae]
MTLPLALICIGGTLSLAALRKSGSMALSASLVKMIGLPLVATLGAWLLGFRGPELGILFLYF